MNLIPTIYCRPLGRHYTAKLIAEAVFTQSATLLDAWAFEQDLVVTRSALGSVQLGFFEVVQVVGAQERKMPDGRVLALLHDDAGLRRAAAAGLRVQPRGLESLIVDAGDTAAGIADLLQAAQREYLPFERALQSCPWRGQADDMPPAALAAPASVREGEAAVMGFLWRVQATMSLRTLVTLRLAELVLGSDEHESLLRPLRDRGDVYATFARYLYDVGVFVLAAAGSYTEEKAHRVAALLEAASDSYFDKGLDRARDLYAARLRMAETATNFHYLASYLLVRPDTTVEELIDLSADITATEVMSVLGGAHHTILQKVAGHGLF